MKMGHRCCSKQKVKRGLWSPEEDEKLVDFVTSNGHSSWSSVPKLAGLQRCGKSCRLRWINYLRPDLKRGSFTEEEERTIIEVHRILGNRWAQIAKHLPGRTDNEVKNFWNSCIKKKLLAQGFDPNTHNLLPPRKQSTSINNNSNNNNDVSPKKADQVFTVNTIRTNKKDTSSPNMEMISSYIQSNTESINLQPSSTVGWSFSKEQISSAGCLDECRFGLIDEASMLIDQQQMVPAEEVSTMQIEEMSAAMEEADELQALNRLQLDSERLDHHLPPFSNNGGSGFEFGFGDYDTIMESGIYDVVSSMNELPWDIVN